MKQPLQPTQALPTWAIKLLVAAAVPAIACMGMYAVDFSQDASGWRAVLSITAFPLLLIALVGLYRSLTARTRKPGSRLAPAVWGAWALAEAAILIASRL